MATPATPLQIPAGLLVLVRDFAYHYAESCRESSGFLSGEGSYDAYNFHMEHTNGAVDRIKALGYTVKSGGRVVELTPINGGATIEIDPENAYIDASVVANCFVNTVCEYIELCKRATKHQDTTTFAEQATLLASKISDLYGYAISTDEDRNMVLVPNTALGAAGADEFLSLMEVYFTENVACGLYHWEKYITNGYLLVAGYLEKLIANSKTNTDLKNVYWFLIDILTCYEAIKRGEQPKAQQESSMENAPKEPEPLMRGTIIAFLKRCRERGENPFLSDIDLRGMNLSGLDFSNCLMANVLAEGANFEGANLERADLSGAMLIGANFTQANLQSAVLCNANISNTTFDGADLTYTNFNFSSWNGKVSLKNCKSAFALRAKQYDGREQGVFIVKQGSRYALIRNAGQCCVYDNEFVTTNQIVRTYPNIEAELKRAVESEDGKTDLVG